LAEFLKIEVQHLNWLADRRQLELSTEKEKLRNYRYSWIRKRSGGLRLVESPRQRMKQTQ